MVGLLLPARRGGARSLLIAAAATLTLALETGGSPMGLTVAAFTAIAVLAKDLARTISLGARLSRAVAALASTDDAEHVLAKAVGGRSVSIGYPVADGCLVDREGRQVPAPPRGWTVVEIAARTAESLNCGQT